MIIRGKYLGKGSTQGLDDTVLTTEAQYWINFSRLNRKFSLSLHYHGDNSFLFANATKIYQLKAKDPEKNTQVFRQYLRRFFSQ